MLADHEIALLREAAQILDRESNVLLAIDLEEWLDEQAWLVEQEKQTSITGQPIPDIYYNPMSDGGGD